MNSSDAILAMREAIQKVATGPEYSKDSTQPQAQSSMNYILSDKGLIRCRRALVRVLRPSRAKADPHGMHLSMQGHHHLGRENSLASAANKARQVLDSGKALPLFKQQQS